jgi:HAE1 family hydrophobic/amphiphilic exporter-1
MSTTELFIRRPIMTTLVMLGILLFGIFGYRLLAVSDLPNVDFPTIMVSANLPGASPETMASSVATPLERQFSTISGVDSMTSTSGLGTTRITLQFALNRDIDAAAQDVQTAISQAVRSLPPGMPSPPSYRKVNPADAPVLYLAMSSPTLSLSAVDEYAESFIAPRVSMISGVAQVDVHGAQKYAVRVRLDPQALATAKREHAHGNPAWSETGTYAEGERPAVERRSLPATHCGLPQWVPCPPSRPGQGDR